MYLGVLGVFCIIRHRACANGVPSVCFFVCVLCSPHYFSTCLLSYFSTMFTVGIFTVGIFTVGMFTVGMYTVGRFTVNIFTVGLVLFVVKGPTPTSPPWPRRVSTFWCHILHWFLDVF